MSCMAIALHIQLRDIPSTRSPHAAAMGEGAGGSGRWALTVVWLATLPTMPVLAERCGCRPNRSSAPLWARLSGGRRLNTQEMAKGRRYGTLTAGPRTYTIHCPQGKAQHVPVRSYSSSRPNFHARLLPSRKWIWPGHPWHNATRGDLAAAQSRQVRRRQVRDLDFGPILKSMGMFRAERSPA